MGSWHFADTNAACLEAGVSVHAALTNIVWTGVNSNIVYKTKKLAMRYLPGETAIVNLLNRTDKPGSIGFDYYIGVYEVTQKQWELVAGSPAQCSWVSDLKPVNSVSYNSIRGADETNYWSKMTGGNAPHPDSFLGKLRARTGVAFDLPTRAMHEYATQANSRWRFANDGNSTSGSKNGAWNDDSPFKNIPISAADIDPNLPGTYDENAGYNVGPSEVGSFACNKVGLFDTIGNVREWCVDWHDAGMKQSNYTELMGAANVDPKDPSLIWKNNKDEKRGSMRYCAGTTYLTSLKSGMTPNYFNAKEAGLAPDGASRDTGLRLVIVVGK
jgi:formylglycine-generating enzyme required for sulfatase activity